MRQVNHLDSFKGIKYLTKTVLSGAVAWLVMSIFSVVAASAAELAAVRPSAMANEPQQLVRELTEDMFSTVDREWDEIRANPLRVYEIVDEIIAPHIDTQRASRLVLPNAGAKASPRIHGRSSSENSIQAAIRWVVNRIPIATAQGRIDPSRRR